MEQNSLKRRLISRDPNEYTQNSGRLLVDSGTNTDCQTPMQLNAWTQTSEESLIKASLPLIDELKGRIQKLEELFRTLNTNGIISTTSSNIVHIPNVIEAEQMRNAIKPPQQAKYKIITSKGVEYIEPVEVVYEEQDGTYMDHDLNNSNDSQRLEICLPKDDEDQQPQPEQQVVQEIPQNQQQIYYQTEEVPQHQDHQQTKYYNIPTAHNTLVSTVSQTPIPSPIQQPSQSTPVAQSSPQNIAKKDRSTPKANKSFLGSATNLNEITSSSHKEPTAIHDGTNVVVSLGPHNTQIPAHVYESMDWSSATAATRKLLITIFDRETLATHTMTGKPSPAFRGRNMPTKQQLDALVVSDIIFVVSRKCGVPEKDVRNAITTKCADENKMSKQREKKRKSLAEYNKENVKSEPKVY